MPMNPNERIELVYLATLRAMRANTGSANYPAASVAGECQTAAQAFITHMDAWQMPSGYGAGQRRRLERAALSSWGGQIVAADFTNGSPNYTAMSALAFDDAEAVLAQVGDVQL